MKTANEILDSVKQILEERERNYDNPKPNFQRIANYWNAYLGERLSTPITPSDVAIIMILMKIAREQFKHSEDNLMDSIGYAVCALRMTEDEKSIEYVPTVWKDIRTVLADNFNREIQYPNMFTVDGDKWFKSIQVHVENETGEL